MSNERNNMDGGTDLDASGTGGNLDSGTDTNRRALDGAVQSADAAFDGRPVDSSTQPCNPPAPQYACGGTRWIDTHGYCGDAVRLECLVTGYPPDSPANVEILHPSTGVLVETVACNLSGGRADATWIAKSQSAGWRTDRIRFRLKISSLGLTCTSANQFQFRQRPVTGWMRQDWDYPVLNDTNSPVVSLYDVALEQARVHQSLKIKLTGAGMSAATQAAAKSQIESVWNGNFTSRKFHRVHCLRGWACNCQFDCCKAGFRLDVNFVSASENVAIEITRVPPGGTSGISATGRVNSRWYDPPLNAVSTYAHETGHLLGQFDEYPSGGNDPSGIQPASSPVPNLMSTSGNTTLLNRHYRLPLAILNHHSGGDAYEIIP